MRIHNFLLFLVVFGLVITSLLYTYSELIDTYGVEDRLNVTHYQRYDLNDDLANLTDTANDLLTNKTVTEGAATENTAANMWSALKLIYRTPAMVNQLISHTIEDLHVPPFVRTYAMVFISIIIIFSLVYLFWRVQT